MTNVFGAPTGPRVNVTLEAMAQVQADVSTEISAEQVTARDAMQNFLQEAVNPFARTAKMRKPLQTSRNRISKALKHGEKADQTPRITQAKKDLAEEFQKRNPELKSSALLHLLGRLKLGSTKEEILKNLLSMYSDVALADEALDFLLQTTDGELLKNIKEAKEELQKQFGREIRSGRNIEEFARSAVYKGLGTPTTLRDLYRDVTGNPRDSTTLFQELSQRYAFKDLKKVVDFLLHSLGSDLNAKGSSIDAGQLHRLLTETRSLQAILGVYRFFNNRMVLVNKLFQKEGLEIPAQLNFESMAKQFMALAGDRYPSADKVKQSAGKLGLDKWITAKIIALSQFRDAVREVAVNQIYRSLQHRDEFFLAILDALEELEDELEQLLEQEEEEAGEREEGEEENEERGKAGQK